MWRWHYIQLYTVHFKRPEEEVRLKMFLISEVKDRPRLWDKSHPEAKKNGLRKGDWAEITELMHEAFKNNPQALVTYKADTPSKMCRLWHVLIKYNNEIWKGIEERKAANRGGKCIHIFSYHHQYRV